MSFLQSIKELEDVLNSNGGSKWVETLFSPEEISSISSMDRIKDYMELLPKKIIERNEKKCCGTTCGKKTTVDIEDLGL